MKNFDLAIIGAGPAGYAGAIRAARAGRTVVLIERDRVGGVCLNRGCIPTKALRQCADALVAAKESARFGVVLDHEPRFDYQQAAAHRDQVTDQLVSGIMALLKARKIARIKGQGRVEGPGRVAVETADGVESIGCEHVIVATGSEPRDLPGITIDEERVLSSEGALRLNALPASVIVIGAGVIGCEWADLLADFGVKTRVVEVLARVLPIEDRATAKAAQKTLAAKGVEFYLSTTVESLERVDGGVRCVLSDGKELSGEVVIVGVGRRSSVDGLGLEAAGVELERSAIKVDSHGATTAPGIWAAGDVIGPPMLAHVAAHEVEVVVDNVLGQDREFERDAVPAVVFTRPEIASVGLLEDQAKERKVPVDVGRFGYAANGKAHCMGETAGSAKVVVAKDGGLILGGTVVGAHAAELAQELAVAIKSRLTVADLMDVVHAHPTLSEIVLEAVADSKGLATHKVGRVRR